MRGACRATKRNGAPCTASATGANGYCWAHDPVNREKRKGAAAKAGRSKPGRELKEMKADLHKLIRRVLFSDLDKGRAAVALQGYNTLLRAIELERKVKEVKEMEERMKAVEQAIEGGRGWGA